DKVTAALQSVGLSADYLSRKIDELSGGEKQRVAIARAIVKDSKIILADEPTGNLDSTTGESIWNILKDLSAEKLVVVVTHDRESAEKYGDRIIEISDGKIISDSGEQPESTREAQTFSTPGKGLSPAVCFKMGVNNLAQRKVKSASVILLAIFTIFAILLTQVILCFSSEKSIAKFVNDNDIDYIEITQGTLRRGNGITASAYMPNTTANYIERNVTYIKNGFVESKQDILDMGLSFVGEALELDDYSFYMTSERLEQLYHEKFAYVEVDGKAVLINKQQHPAKFLVGKKVKIDWTRPFNYTFAGVIDVSKCNPLSGWALHRDYYAKESFAGRTVTTSKHNSLKTPDITLEFGNAEYSKNFFVTPKVDDIALDGKILTERGLQEHGEVELADDEIVLSYYLYAHFFSMYPMLSYVSPDLTECIRMPEYIGQSFPLKIYDDESGELIYDAGEFKIAGIGFSNTDYEAGFTTGANAIKKISMAIEPQKYLVEVASIENLQKFLVDFRAQHNGYVTNAGVDTTVKYSFVNYANLIYGFERGISLFKIIFSTIAAVLSVILLLLVMNLISFSILNRKKEIGILSALGATNRDIIKIFLIEILFIAAVAFVVNLVAIIVATVVFNKTFCAAYTLGVTLLRVDIVTVTTLIVSSFGLLLLAALIPLRKIIKLKPIDAIKNL
ncbi:MAG: FtsX-like permease family protein, partial [Clostridia bacterium]|nr:FtsX-like permease family protein [Clostridia bacterium]